MVRGLWGPDVSGLHINILEMSAVFLALQHFKSISPNKCIMVSYIKEQGEGLCVEGREAGGGGRGHSPSLCMMVVDLLCW